MVIEFESEISCKKKLDFTKFTTMKSKKYYLPNIFHIFTQIVTVLWRAIKSGAGSGSELMGGVVEVFLK